MNTSVIGCIPPVHVNTSVIGCIPPVHVNTSVIGCYALYKARELSHRGRGKKGRRKIDQGINKSLCIDLSVCWCCVPGTVSIFKNSKDTVKVEILILVEICSDLLIVLRYI